MSFVDLIRQQIQVLGNVPEPSDDAVSHSHKLYQTIVEQANNGAMTFHDFMHMALYAPGLGYYSAGAHKIGPAGDFITAPELSPLFGQCVAIQVQQVMSDDCNSLLEFGAGTGRLAVSIMAYLAQVDSLPEHYIILEPSPDLRQRQQQLITTEIPQLAERFRWLSELPESFSGVVIANEVIDAMPVHGFRVTGGSLEEMMVTLDADQQLTMAFSQTLSPELEAWWSSCGQQLNLPDGYVSEVNLAMNGWINAIGECLDKGLVLLIDYGFPMAEYYLPERSSGTIKCHYRHRHHDDPLVLLGLQDITAHVDFTSVAETGLASGLDVLGYANQGSFLTSCGILQLAESEVGEDLKKQVLMAQQIKPLIMPEEMGELFKVMALAKQIDPVALGGLIGYRYLDQRHLLG